MVISTSHMSPEGLYEGFGLVGHEGELRVDATETPSHLVLRCTLLAMQEFICWRE